MNIMGYVFAVVMSLAGLVPARADAVSAPGEVPRVERFSVALNRPSGGSDESISKAVEGMLWPGESFTYAPTGVKLSWELGRADQQTSAPGGVVVIQGVHASRRIPISARPGEPNAPRQPGQNRSPQPLPMITAEAQGQYYLDDTVLNFSVSINVDRHGGIIRSQQGMRYWFYFQPHHFAAGAAPFQSSELFVSAGSPLSVGDLHLSLSDAPVTYPGGQKMFQLQVRNGATSETVTMPAASGSTRQVGRYNIGVGTVYELSQTARIRIVAQADLRPLGADSYITNLEVREGTRVEETLAALAKQYHFSVEWREPVAGHPEAIDYAENIKARSTYRITDRTLRNNLEPMLNQRQRADSDDYIATEWTDAGHLRVWAKNYDKIIARQEEEQRKQETAARAQAEREKELAAFKAKFEKDYKGGLQVFTLQKVRPEAVRPLLQKELSAYYLVDAQVTDPQVMNGPNGIRGEVIEKGKYYAILRTREDPENALERKLTPQIFVDAFHETVVVDDRAGAIIARVSRPTAEKIAEMTDRLQAVIREERAKPRQYRIELILLATEKGTTQTAAKNNYSPSDREITFEGKEYVFEQASSGGMDYTVYYRRKKSANESATAPAPPYNPEKIWMPFYVQVLNGGGENEELVITFRQVPKVSENNGIKSAKDYGIDPEDLKGMGLDKVRELGRGAVMLAGEAGEIGKATVALNETYRCQLAFQDERSPYLLVKGDLIGGPGDKPLLSNTLFLEKGKPALLGLTNLKEALILLVQRTE